MINIKKAAELLEQPAAHIKKQQNHFTSIIGRAKVRFIKTAAWLLIAGGV
jgi:hypothetical protein